MMNENKGVDFEIASHVPEYSNPLEYDLHNLKLRLRILNGWVEQTESQIRNLEEIIANGENGK